MLLRVKVVTKDFKKFYVTISCHDKYRLWEGMGADLNPNLIIPRFSYSVNLD